MTTFVHELISHRAQCTPEAIALQIKDNLLSYTLLNEKISTVAQGYLSLAINQGDRIGIYLAKNQENIQAMFACSVIGAVFVPINPVLKAPQVQYIANDCQIKLLITNHARLKALMPILEQFPELATIIVIDANEQELTQLTRARKCTILNWQNNDSNRS